MRHAVCRGQGPAVSAVDRGSLRYKVTTGDTQGPGKSSLVNPCHPYHLFTLLPGLQIRDAVDCLLDDWPPQLAGGRQGAAQGPRPGQLRQPQPQVTGCQTVPCITAVKQ